MFDKEAIVALQEAASISAASDAVQQCDKSQYIAALPSEYALHDFEQYQALRRRARGQLETQHLPSFAEYVEKHAEAGASVFVNVPRMKAVGVLNLGTPDAPGHADNVAAFEVSRTAAFSSLNAINESKQKQNDLAEFLEDWSDCIKCFSADRKELQINQAIAAVRKVSIENMRKLQVEDQSLSASRSVFEKAEVGRKEEFPAFIEFTCQPYTDFTERTFVLRISVMTSDEKITLMPRIIKLNEHQEAMGQELADKVKACIPASINVMLGTYTKR